MLFDNYLGNFESIKTLDLDKPLEDYMKAIRKDKKQVSESLTAVLISSYGENGELSVVHDVTEQEIDYAINYFKKLYRA